MFDISLIKVEGRNYFKKVSKKSDLDKLDFKNFEGFFIDTNGNEKEARRIVETLKDKKIKKKIAILASDDSFNRRVVETLKCDYLVSPERTKEKDSLKQRASGINHVVAKEAIKKKIAVVVSLDELEKSLNEKEKSKKISRIIQNVKICRKAKCRIKIATFATKENQLLSEKEIQAIGFSWGMSSQQVKDCTKF